MDTINILGRDLTQTSEQVVEEVATPYKANETDFFEKIQEFTTSSFISNASKIKAQQIISTKPYLDDMYRCMMDYANFLNYARSEFRNADEKSVDSFHKPTI